MKLANLHFVEEIAAVAAEEVVGVKGDGLGGAGQTLLLNHHLLSLLLLFLFLRTLILTQ